MATPESRSKIDKFRLFVSTVRSESYRAVKANPTRTRVSCGNERFACNTISVPIYLFKTLVGRISTQKTSCAQLQERLAGCTSTADEMSAEVAHV